MPVVYIRHGDDEEFDPEYKEDPGLRSRAFEDINELADRLVRRYGPPTMIISSPLLRTRQTAKIMAKRLQSQGYQPPLIRVDPRVSRYFLPEQSHRRYLHPKYRHEIPINESYSQFKARVENHLDRMEDIQDEEMVWVITHNLILKAAAERYGLEVPKAFSFLEHFVTP